jgi:hypothetical protein
VEAALEVPVPSVAASTAGLVLADHGVQRP